MTKKATDKQKNMRPDAKKSNFLTLIAVLVGIVLMLGGVAVVVIKLIEVNQAKPVPGYNCMKYNSCRYVNDLEDMPYQ